MLIQGLYTLSLFLQKSWQGLAKASHAFSLAKTMNVATITVIASHSVAIHNHTTMKLFNHSTTTYSSPTAGLSSAKTS